METTGSSPSSPISTAPPPPPAAAAAATSTVPGLPVANFPSFNCQFKQENNLMPLMEWQE